MGPEVAVTGGKVRGVSEDDVAVFRGIPFASLSAPFDPPKGVTPWAGVRDATAFGPPAPQAGALGLDGPVVDHRGWLTINVWSPDMQGSLPVMVWIHGGAYMFGTSALPEYDGTILARSGVVLVTFNYRVGLPGFGLVDGTVPNRGLLDQVAALRWVQANIHRFGGDPGRVTVFGQSAGAGSLAALLAMPLASGLFRRAIAQSVQGTYFTPALAADIARHCAAELGVASHELTQVDPWLLPLAADAVLTRVEEYAGRWGRAAHAPCIIAPVVDGRILPATPWEGLSGQVELMVGHTRDEQRLLTALAGGSGDITPEQALRTAEIFTSDPGRYGRAFPDPGQLEEVVRSDWLFRMPSLKLAEAQLGANGTAYLYELTWPAPGMGGGLGACHGLDVPLVFGNLTAGQPALLIGEVTTEADAVSRQMRTAWVAFAATGDPGWPGYHTGATRLFDTEPTVTDYPEQVSRDIWRQQNLAVLGLSSTVRDKAPDHRSRA